jgi:hypothetical protein
VAVPALADQHRLVKADQHRLVKVVQAATCLLAYYRILALTSTGLRTAEPKAEVPALDTCPASLRRTADSGSQMRPFDTRPDDKLDPLSVCGRGL